MTEDVDWRTHFQPYIRQRSVTNMNTQPIPIVNGQNSNLQNISNVDQNFMVQGMPPNMVSNTQRQMQQQVVPQQHPQHYLNQQQENLSSKHQQQISKDNNVNGLQQHQFIGLQSGNSGMPSNQQNMHMLQQSQQMQLPQQQLMSQIQSKIAQLQQQIVSLQQQAIFLQRDTHQGLQTSSPLLHQNVVDLQKQMSQLPMQIPDNPSSCLDSITQTGSFHGQDWQEEAYQKIRSMKEMYFVELNELYQRLETKIEQHDIPEPKNDNLQKLKFFKAMLEKLLQFLLLNKNDIEIGHREKIGPWEKQIENIFKSKKPRKPVSSLPQGQTNGYSESKMQANESQMSSQMQSSMNIQGSVVQGGQQHNSLSSAFNISRLQQNMVNSIQSGSGLGLNATQGNAPSLFQQVALGSIRQNPVHGSQTSESGMNTILNKPLQQNSNTSQQLMQQQRQQLQKQQLQQQLSGRQLISPQQQKQSLARQLTSKQQQQLLLASRLLYPQQQQLGHRQVQQQKQREQQTKQQQLNAQLPSHNMSQIHQMTGVKSGMLQQHHPDGQSGTSFISSPSHQVTQHLSPQIDQQNMPTSSIPNAATPLQSSSSPFIITSPTTSLAPSPILPQTEKVDTGVLQLTLAGAIGVYLFIYLLGLFGFIHLSGL